MQTFNDLAIDKSGFNYKSKTGISTYCSYELFLIGQARGRGCDFENLADGYGVGMGTHGDWSGIRDSSDGAVEKMLERALNFLFSK